MGTHPSFAGARPGDKIYFRSLDGLRFFAALLVVIEHCIMFKRARDATLSNAVEAWFEGVGSVGVDLFFVLSGFLVSYLLIVEVARTDRVDIPRFYVRRALRIWPLYFLVGLGGTIAGPVLLARMGIAGAGAGLGTNVTCVMLFAVNLQLVFLPFNRAIVEILWSVCLEEQFYLVWPWVVRAGRRRLSWALGGVAAASIASLFVFRFAWPWKTEADPLYFFPLCKFLLFAAGGAAAHLLHRAPARFAFVERPAVQAAVFAATLAIVAGVVPYGGVYPLGWLVNPVARGLVFSLLMVTLVSPACAISLEHPLLQTFGRISYGIYVYHTFIVQLVLLAFLRFAPRTALAFGAAFPATAIAATLLCAWLSYRIYEAPFLRRKTRFQVVRSGGEMAAGGRGAPVVSAAAAG